ncbi:UPF0158 family protein [Clostridium magnum]|uniref:Uncharacterized protein n=1 Tax=Clostridium magnum DSM 2767 TaxID=1121326 RepID=A0A162T304_9CLOT|nr:UPF0158 family protein [Clostridium magnum]KZL92183.1 hypothetical protein CLMAG_19920 [Clostridium magnum DSM 2767]SHH18955.1 Uncharacterised protein family (UPF0158) [Clostridium magnum DSM 2767]
MIKLNIDLDLLMQSFSFNEDNLGKEYLDTHTGDIINIPAELKNVVEGESDESELEDWQKELLGDAYAIAKDESNRYIIISNIEDSYFYNLMVNFSNEKVSSADLRAELIKSLNINKSIRDFKNILFRYPQNLDAWQEYEEAKLREYTINWLRDRGIELE